MTQDLEFTSWPTSCEPMYCDLLGKKSFPNYKLLVKNNCYLGNEKKGCSDCLSNQTFH